MDLGGVGIFVNRGFNSFSPKDVKSATMLLIIGAKCEAVSVSLWITPSIASFNRRPK